MHRQGLPVGVTAGGNDLLAQVLGHAHDVGHQLVGMLEGRGAHALQNEPAAFALRRLHIGAESVVDVALAVAQRAGHLTAQVVGGKNFLQGLFSKTGHCYTSQCFGRKACPAAPFQIIFILVEERFGGNTAFRTLFARSFTKAGTHGANYRRGVPRLCLRYSMGLMPISLRKLWEK